MSPAPAKKPLTTAERIDRLERILKGLGFHEPRCSFIQRPAPDEVPPDPPGNCDCWLSEATS